ncbi:hypothetical protein GUITHDRAFT_112349 [Guillardia theta CCMP2712]|uniref:Uncharacterized protein n=2 Tax=Guillardia theta TaxID=55529 RepID=L1IZX0_GUITC|nr:hypothetical protein GUITHDRAFT_112349 [Guillardia theta CCMP2712]EKX41642.1 hypothetical protein GUITHDRAFT_112349 [Guillardia theta CCMP2712]|eukprot:XP_005828622.1 hypothetical protein GUITHDRAFT_112349 [Guillardia theta CCMP2712]
MRLQAGTFRDADVQVEVNNGSVFIDFRIVEEEDYTGTRRRGKKLLKLVRISFDGFGCRDLTSERVRPMDVEDSRKMLGMMGSNGCDEEELERIVRKNIAMNQSFIWEDALKAHGLI